MTELLDVPDTLWIGTGDPNAPFVKDVEKFKKCFREWMKPHNLEIVNVNFVQGFAWGTVQLPSEKCRNRLLEHAKTKVFRIDGKRLEVKPFSMRKKVKKKEAVKKVEPAKSNNNAEKKKTNSKLDGAAGSSQNLTLAGPGKSKRAKKKAQKKAETKLAQVYYDSGAQDELDPVLESLRLRVRNLLEDPLVVQSPEGEDEMWSQISSKSYSSSSNDVPGWIPLQTEVQLTRPKPFDVKKIAPEANTDVKKCDSESDDTDDYFSYWKSHGSASGTKSDLKSRDELGASRRSSTEQQSHAIKTLKAVIVSYKKSSVHPFEAKLMFSNKPTLLMSVNEVKNLTPMYKDYPGDLVGSYIIVHLFEDEFLFAELENLYDKNVSDATNNEIRNYLKTLEAKGLDSKREVSTLREMFRQTQTVTDVQDWVHFLIEIEEVKAKKKTIASAVEIFDDQSDLSQEEEHVPLESLLPPLMPGEDTEDYESVFVLPETQELDKKNVVEHYVDDVDDGRSTSPVESEMEAFLAINYFGRTRDMKECRAKARQITSDLRKSGLTCSKVLAEFQAAINGKNTLDSFCQKIASLVEGKKPKMGELWYGVHPVLCFLLSNFFPAGFASQSIFNIANFISFKSSNGHFYQFIGVIEQTSEGYGIISSPIGFVLYSDMMLKVQPGESVVGMLVHFYAWNERLLPEIRVPTFVASKVAFHYKDLGLDNGPTVMFNPSHNTNEKLVMQQFLSSQKNVRKNSRENFKESIKKFSKEELKNLDRVSIDSLLVDEHAYDSLLSLKTFYMRNFENGKQVGKEALARMFVSVWARLGYSKDHLRTEFDQLHLLGGQKLVFNCWLDLLYHCRLPSSVNPVRLIDMTMSYFVFRTSQMTYADFSKFIQTVSSNRSYVDDLIPRIRMRTLGVNPYRLPHFASNVVFAKDTQVPDVSKVPDSVTAVKASDRSVHQSKSSLDQGARIVTEKGATFTLSLNQNGDLPAATLLSRCPGVVALKYKTNDQTWRIIGRAGDVFCQPFDGWDGKIFMTVTARLSR